jgi:Bifunctional DNA primase/polymerase, N-terminal
MLTVRDYASRYRDAGLRLCRLPNGSKRPLTKGWPIRTAEPSDFGESDGVGILTGWNNLVCVDLDDRRAVALADFFLPPTGMVEGRPVGKPRSHWWYYVEDVPPHLEAATALVVGGARTHRWARASDRRVILELLGSGRHACVPPSPWKGPDGSQERRQWQAWGEPAAVPMVDLLASCARLAAVCGWAPPPERKPVVYRPRLVLPDRQFLLRRAERYLTRVPPAVKGQGHHCLSNFVACQLLRLFDLTDDELLGLVLTWNSGCHPPRSRTEVQAICSHARRAVRPALVG